MQRGMPDRRLVTGNNQSFHVHGAVVMETKNMNSACTRAKTSPWPLRATGPCTVLHGSCKSCGVCDIWRAASRPASICGVPTLGNLQFFTPHSLVIHPDLPSLSSVVLMSTSASHSFAVYTPVNADPRGWDVTRHATEFLEDSFPYSLRAHVAHYLDLHYCMQATHEKRNWKSKYGITRYWDRDTAWYLLHLVSFCLGQKHQSWCIQDSESKDFANCLIYPPLA